ncbi:DUF402 domain-containing protein [Nocardioides sp. AE5]|uniref:DUF402 domain-containing protein n=1 Tax=Nocardioides sp. AE5 TaxID=2962573 RepID=UPI0028824975|nr:DUF402 domain-containing protein [Nocardioides sp. AE5]MDT0202395.1 DUF402 domain-containing protein [Nocardioides sp. AE5]
MPLDADGCDWVAHMQIGEQVRVATTKWRDRPHWSYAGIHLGSDEHGDWIGLPAGTHFARPGKQFEAPAASLTLVPAADLPERGWLAAFHPDQGTWTYPGVAELIEVYVDITTAPVTAAGGVRAVDLDLDIIRARAGRTWIDDEDEFAEHQCTLGYPADLIAQARRSCAWVHDQVSRCHPPYDGATAEQWLQRLAEMTGSGTPAKS